MIRAVMTGLLGLIAGCSSTLALQPIEYQFIDVPAQSKVEVTYRNQSGTTMCLLPEHWPNQAGKINQAGDIVFLVVAGRRFPILDFNTGYCPQGCAIRVEPGETAAGFIRYADFELPEQLRDAPKTLEFSPMAFPCPRE